MTINVRGLDGEPVEIPPEALQNFKTAFKGPVLVPGDAAYDEMRAVWNAMIDRRPALIVRCTGTADVVQAVRFCRQHRLLVSVRGGGHNIAGLAVCEAGVMIDMSLLKGVWVDPAQQRVRAQAGCTLADVDRETQLHGLAAVLGFVSTTGIAGLTVGGGFGYLTRRYGWTCDNLLSMEVVTAEAEILRASENENEDLFWALRGGGGNFGIVTSFEFRTYPVGPEILGGAIAWRAEEARQVLEAYRHLSANAPRELTSVATLRRAPPAPWLPKDMHGQPIVAVFACHTGRIEEGEKLLESLRRLGSPVADTLGPRPYTQMQTLLDATQPKGRRYYWKSHYLSALDPQLIETAMEQAARILSPHSAIILFQIDGALRELPTTHSPVGNRDAAYVLNIMASWEKAEDDAANLKWARDGFAATQRFSTGGVYLNFLTEDEGADRIEAAYGRSNLQKLASLKDRYDPERFFRHTKQVVA